jgi:hypothetical protein
MPWLGMAAGFWGVMGCLLSMGHPTVSNVADHTDTEAPALFARGNLIAWCIVPFDARRRGPEERVAMLKRLKFERYAYDWRAEHLPSFERELQLLHVNGIKLQAVWFPAQPTAGIPRTSVSRYARCQHFPIKDYKQGADRAMNVRGRAGPNEMS